jgi:hypothetical protein
MEKGAFEATFCGIAALNGAEGPTRNVFEPKFQAREQLISLRTAVKNSMRNEVSVLAVSQYIRCTLLLAHNFSETEEDDDAVKTSLHAYSVLATSGADLGLLKDVENIRQVSLEEVLKSEEQLTDSKREFVLVAECVEVLNAIGLFFSNGTAKLRLQDAVAVLRNAEKLLGSWLLWSSGKIPRITEIPLKEDGTLEREKCADAALCELGLRMHHCETNTCYYLAQAFAATGNTREASKYCHQTMIHQLQNKKEFSKRDWATNALQLSSFYVSERDYAKALHCLKAADLIMPKEKPSEENVGMVAWAFGKYHLARLKSFSSSSGEETLPDPARKDMWWKPFPLAVGECATRSIHSFDDARDEFKEGKRRFDTALTYYVMDGCCTDHIAILQDVGSLYKALSDFEPDLDRKIAMLQRRVDLIEHIPATLSFQAYATLIRQMLFDLGDMYTEILDLRVSQKKDTTGKCGKPLSDSKFNELCSKTQSFFERFIETYKDPKTRLLPVPLESDLRIPVFRAFMRSAQLESRRFHKTPKDDYDTVGRTISRYEQVVAFAKENPMDGSVNVELKLAADMLQLLPGKQRELWRLHNRN